MAKRQNNFFLKNTVLVKPLWFPRQSNQREREPAVTLHYLREETKENMDKFLNADLVIERKISPNSDQTNDS